MEKIVKENNVIKYYINNKLTLIITILGNNKFITENKFYKIEGYCKKIDDYRLNIRIYRHFKRGKNGQLYSNKKEIPYSVNWFGYILQAKGLVEKTLPIL